MAVVFLSYRRSDTGGYAGRLADALEVRFGKGSVFQDVAAIAPGSNFVDAINAAVARCGVLIVLIGDTWLTEKDAGGRERLADPEDFVRLEVASALRQGRPVLPVLVEGAAMPTETSLPPELRTLAQLQALELSDSRWEYDAERLANAVRALSGHKQRRGRRGALVAAVAGGVMILIVASGVQLFSGRPADVSGRWNLPNGSFWIVAQDGNRLVIDETHYESRQVWKRGGGTVDKDRLDFALTLVYGQPHRYEGTLKVSSDGSTLTGEVHDVRRGAKERMALSRAR
jgi:TIR domain